MFRKPYFSITVIALIVFTGCIIPGARKERAEIELQRNDSLFVIDEGDFHFRIVLPKDIMINSEPIIKMAGNGQSLHITCGSTFHVVAEITDIKTTKLPIGEGIFHYDIIDNEDQSFVFKRILPDGNSYDYGLIQYSSIGENDYAFSSSTEGEFSLNDVLRMKGALASVKM
jgi:hypothetical protein